MTIQEPLLCNRFQLKGAPLRLDNDHKVYRALDLWYGRDVLLKACRGPLTGEGPAELVREAAVLERCTHPSVVGGAELLWEEGEGGWWVFARTWLEGTPLSRRVGAMDGAALTDLAVQLLSVVGWLHQSGWEALDLKVEHLIQAADGRWCLIDLGQARPPSLLSEGGGEGTWAWSSPEVLRGEPCTQRSDLYTVGLILYAAWVGGLPPSVARSPLELADERRDPPSWPAGVRPAPEALRTLMLGLLSPAPERRPSVEVALASVLGEGAALRPTSPPHPPWVERAPLWAALESWLASAGARGGGQSRLSAAPGMGTTRTLRRWLAHVGRRGHPVIWLGSELDDAGRLAVLTRALAALGGAAVDEGPPDSAEACRDLAIELHRVARSFSRGLILVGVDVPQRPTPLSDRLIEVLAEHAEGSHLAVLIARREGERVADGALTLGPLGVGALQPLVDALAAGHGLPFSTPQLHRVTEGRPAWVVDALWRCRQVPGFALEGWAPPVASELHRRLVAALGEAGREGLQLAALAGERFERAWWEGAGGQRQVLQALVHGGALASEGGWIRWRSEGLRREVVAAIASEKVEALAWRLADAGVALWPDPTPSQCARHALLLIRARQAGAAVQWLTLALKDGAALPVEERLPLRASLLEQLPPTSPSRWVHRLRQGEELIKLTRFKEAAAVLTPFEEEAQGEEIWAQGIAALGWAYLRMGFPDRAQRLLEQAITSGRLPQEVAALAVHRLVYLLLHLELYQAADEQLSRVDRMAALPPELRLAQTRLRVEVALRLGAPPADHVQALQQAIAECQERRLPREELRLLNVMQELTWRTGDSKRSLALCVELVEKTRARLDREQEATMTFNLASRLRDAGEGAKALEQYRRVVELKRALGDLPREVEARLWLLDVLVDKAADGIVDAELAQVEELLRALREQGRLDELSDRHFRTLRLRLRVRRQGVSEEVHAEAEDIARGEGSEYSLMTLIVSAMGGALSQGHPEVALRWMELATPERRHRCPTDLQAQLHALASTAHQRLAGEHVGGEGASLSVEGEVQWLARIARLVEVGDDPRRAADTLAQITGEALGARVVLRVIGHEGPDLVSAHLATEQEVKDLSRTVVKQVARTRVARVEVDVQTRGDLLKAPSLVKANVRAMVCVPVLKEGECLAVLYAGYAQPSSAWTQRAERLMTQVAQVTAGLLGLVRRQQHLSTVLKGDLGLIGVSPAMARLRAELGEVCALKASGWLRFFLSGERGTGKSLIAESVAKFGRLKERPYAELNCVAISKEMEGAQLFGNVPGWGMAAGTVGAFTQAMKGTLFMDEVLSLAPRHQAALLAPLSDAGSWSVLGETRKHKADFDLISASNEDAYLLMQQGAFRRDLWDRLTLHGVFRVPTLRERGPDDVLLLVQHYQARVFKEQRGEDPTPEQQQPEWLFSAKAIDYLKRYHWPGNVRQVRGMMENVSVRSLVRAPTPARMSRDEVEGLLDKELMVSSPAPVRSELLLNGNLTMEQVDAQLSELKRAYVQRIVEESGGNRSEAARRLDIHRDTLYGWLGGEAPQKDRSPRRPGKKKKAT